MKSHMQSIPEIQRAAWEFLWGKANPANGLVPDHIDARGAVVSPASVGVTGMALTALPVGAENGWVTRAEAAARARATLHFFAGEAEQHGGFFFHFLDGKSGARAWKSEVSSIDSTFVFLGTLFCAAFFTRKDGDENEIRELAEQIISRADWNFLRGINVEAARHPAATHAPNTVERDAVVVGYTPERGLSHHVWRGWNEALPLVILGLGSPTHALPRGSYEAWTRDYRFKRLYGREWLYCGPLFTHLFPHLWLDLRGQSDAPMRKANFNYFENTRRAVQIQHHWAKKRGDERAWGVSACDGPLGGKLGGYRARGVPFGRFDEVFSPPVCLASLAFEPELASESWGYWREKFPEIAGNWGVRGAVHRPSGWMSGYFGLDQGMLVLGLENWRSGLLWDLSRGIESLQTGLQRAGFEKN